MKKYMKILAGSFIAGSIVSALVVTPIELTKNNSGNYSSFSTNSTFKNNSNKYTTLFATTEKYPNKISLFVSKSNIILNKESFVMMNNINSSLKQYYQPYWSPNGWEKIVQENPDPIPNFCPVKTYQKYVQEAWDYGWILNIAQSNTNCYRNSNTGSFFINNKPILWTGSQRPEWVIQRLINDNGNAPTGKLLQYLEWEAQSFGGFPQF